VTDLGKLKEVLEALFPNQDILTATQVMNRCQDELAHEPEREQYQVLHDWLILTAGMDPGPAMRLVMALNAYHTMIRSVQLKHLKLSKTGGYKP